MDKSIAIIYRKIFNDAEIDQDSKKTLILIDDFCIQYFKLGHKITFSSITIPDSLTVERILNIF